ncbi:hypothetical protein HID58_006870 [Brassica napus]|uniref:Flotillin-like n=2 Tax=Brassica napus TaxID=3708 RepID=A0ABQ8ECK3_BRANA|nr:hypothetical protein HID58_006870 [Brassica napus]
MQPGGCPSTVDVRLLSFWEIRSVKCGGELMGFTCSSSKLRSAEATVLAIPKMEKAKSRATMEACEKAQMMVELEGSKLK